MSKFNTIVKTAPTKLIIEILIASFCVELLTLTIPIFAQLIFDKVIIHNSFSTLYIIGFGAILATFFEGILLYLYSRHIHFLSAIVDEHLTKPALKKIMLLPLSYFDSRPKGQIVSEIHEIQSIRDFLSASSITALIDIIFMVVVLILIALYSQVLVFVVAICIPILILLSIVFRPKVVSEYKILNNRQTDFNSILNEGLNNMTTLKLMSLESFWINRWLIAHENFIDAGLKAKKSAAIEDALLRIIQRLIVLAVLCIGAMEVLKSTLTFGQLLACYMFSLRVLIPSTRIFQVVMGYARIKESQKHLSKLMQEHEESVPSHFNMKFTPGEIIFKNVSFGYLPNSNLVLKNINLVLPSGAYIGIIGKSGSGKSTLSRMLQRHISPQRGEITIGGIDLRDFQLSDLRTKVVLVNQDASLFKGTIRENIIPRDVNISDQTIWHICEVTQCKSFIKELQSGLDTELDEKAVKLSSGQRQRIALARALLANPDVLILDEATNALDLETEMEVLQSIHNEINGRTLIVITHRKHMLKEVDTVIEIIRGEANFQNTHISLTEGSTL
jgi:ATP-binding cassette, subfamily B, bacterial HlyB/CyaB